MYVLHITLNKWTLSWIFLSVFLFYVFREDAMHLCVGFFLNSWSWRAHVFWRATTFERCNGDVLVSRDFIYSTHTHILLLFRLFLCSFTLLSAFSISWHTPPSLALALGHLLPVRTSIKNLMEYKNVALFLLRFVI